MPEDTLYTDCEQCGGFGRWTRPPERAGNSITSYGEEQCTRCDGFGMIFSCQGRQVVEIIMRLKRIGRLH
jgi:DnaJ-class molecular chaperone